jgi:hypothetical protein
MTDIGQGRGGGTFCDVRSSITSCWEGPQLHGHPWVGLRTGGFLKVERDPPPPSSDPTDGDQRLSSSKEAAPEAEGCASGLGADAAEPEPVEATAAEAVEVPEA